MQPLNFHRALGRLPRSQFSVPAHIQSQQINRRLNPCRGYLDALRALDQQGGEGVKPLEYYKHMLQKAIEDEDYEEAATIRDMINQLESKDPIVSLQNQLEKAVKEERFEDAAKLKAKLEALKPPPPEVNNTSNTITNGIRVTCESIYIPAQSNPLKNYYFFAYRIKIINEANSDTVKLKSRYWKILNANGAMQEVRGPGVVGHDLELSMGQSFEYMSSCPLATPSGSMEGNYEFYGKKDSNGNFTTSFLVNIGKFDLSTDGPKEA